MNFSEVILFVALGAVVGFAGALIAIPLLTAGFSFTQHDSQGDSSGD
jgi:predicted PurR-regulated permease PerM